MSHSSTNAGLPSIWLVIEVAQEALEVVQEAQEVAQVAHERRPVGTSSPKSIGALVCVYCCTINTTSTVSNVHLYQRRLIAANATPAMCCPGPDMASHKRIPSHIVVTRIR